MFAQDNWNILPNLNVNLGIRWDGETFTGQNALFSPRVGFAWRVPSSNTVIRGGYGIYYSEERTDLYASAALGGPQGAFTYTAAPGGLGFPTTFAPISFPAGSDLAGAQHHHPGRAVQLSEPVPAGRSVHFCSNNFQNPYTQQWNLGFEHDLGGGWLFAMDYIGSHTIHIEQPVDLNCTVALSSARLPDKRARLRPPMRPVRSFPSPAAISRCCNT